MKYDIVTQALVEGAEPLSYKEALVVWQTDCLPIGLQIAQCHICTRFETDENPLFAYAYLERNGEFRFIYRCIKDHGFDQGKILVDLHTGLEVYL